LLKRAIAGNLVSAEAAAHEIDAARCIDRDGLAVLSAIEGLAWMGSGMAARRTHVVKEMVQDKVDQVAISGKKNGGGSGGGGGGASGSGAGKGKGKQTQKGNNRGKGVKKEWPQGKVDTRDCYTCGAVGHMSRDCSKKAKKN
jgi:hypothetical protein